MKTLSHSIALIMLGMICLIFAGCSREQESTGAALLYPLDTCIVSDEKLGADPDMVPYTFVYKGQEIKLCCKSCLTTFNKEPDTYLAKLPRAGVD